MKALILVGGSGTRLWPLSRDMAPKQFLRLKDNKSFFRATVERLLVIFKPEDVVIVTGETYRWQVEDEIRDTKITNIVSEPCARNTAPAIALGVRYYLDKLGAGEREAIFVFPSDHLVRDIDNFVAALQCAENPARDGAMVVFGIQPTTPQTGYGYIKVSDRRDDNSFRVDRFVEKPDLEKAQEYLRMGNFYWNSGIFAFCAQAFCEEIKRHCPKIHELAGGYRETMNNFPAMPSISLDYAIMEKTGNAVMVPLAAGWSDIGSWDSVYDEFDKDENGNVLLGDIVISDVKNSLVISDKPLTAVVGVADTVVVGSRDVVLVMPRGETQKVRDVVSSLGSRVEAQETPHVKRSWGSYTIIEEGMGYKVKRIEIHPGAKISLQFHKHRSEHWVVISGKAKIRIGEEKIVGNPDESVYVPKGVVHQLENISSENLKIIEVQSGEYLVEDDIVRLEE